MKKAKPPSGRNKKSRQLSASETALWHHMASTLQPLKDAKNRVLAALEDFDGSEKLSGTTPTAKGGANKLTGQPKRAVSPPVIPPAQPKAVSKRAAPPLSQFDTKRARRLRSGRIEVDARIDLHGMRQNEAHIALRGFLHSSHRKGHRIVLVITGKGAPENEGASWGDRHAPRGVLRRNVPQWLSEPDLRALVVSFAPAAQRHGGEGALYVHLRRRG